MSTIPLKTLQDKGRARLQEVISLLSALSECEPFPLEEITDDEDSRFRTQRLRIRLSNSDGSDGGWITIHLNERRAP